MGQKEKKQRVTARGCAFGSSNRDTNRAPKTVAEIGIDPACRKDCFKATKDIRDKYVASRLAWDLGVIDEIADKVF